MITLKPYNVRIICYITSHYPCFTFELPTIRDFVLYILHPTAIKFDTPQNLSMCYLVETYHSKSSHIHVPAYFETPDIKSWPSWHLCCVQVEFPFFKYTHGFHLYRGI